MSLPARTIGLRRRFSRSQVRLTDRMNGVEWRPVPRKRRDSIMQRVRKNPGIFLVSAATALAILCAAPLAWAHHHADESQHSDCRLCVYKQQPQAESSLAPSPAMYVEAIGRSVERYVRPVVVEHHSCAPPRAPPR